MSYTPENNPYIPGDPYSYDLKWIVDKLKEAIALYQPLNDKFDSLEAYVRDYFANLDLTSEVQAIIDSMTASGYFSDLVAAVVNDSGDVQNIIETWLAANITPTSPAVDKSLTIEGAAADAKAAGFRIDSNFKTIGYNDINDLVTNITANMAGLVFEDGTNTYIIFPVIEGDVLKIKTALQPCFINFFQQDPRINVGNTIQRSASYTAPINLVAMGEYTYTIPADAHYVMLQKVVGGVDHTPFEVYINDLNISGSVLEKLAALETHSEDLGLYEPIGTLVEGSVAKIDNTTFASNYYKHVVAAVNPGDKLLISGTYLITNFPLFFFTSNGSTIFTPTGLTNQTEYLNYPVTVPVGADHIYVNADSSITNIRPSVRRLTKEGFEDLEDINGLGYWRNKKVAWFGTSISAGKVGTMTIPSLLSEKLGFNLYNEAIGSSEVRGGTHGAAVTADDPKGYAYMAAPGVFLSFTIDSATKQDLYDNWQSKWKDIITWYQSDLDLTQLARYKASSWDVILPKYLTGGNPGPCDLYVFEHGFNDKVRYSGFHDLADEPATLDDTTYWMGAMAFVFEKILADNPKARILLIGHYSSNQGADGWENTTLLAAAQEKLAAKWNIPLVKLWERTGFDFMPITVSGTTFTPALSWMPDGIHPSSDTSGDCIRHYVNCLLPLFKQMR